MLSLVVSCLVALVVAGCGAGQDTQTASQVSAADGVNGDVGAIALRNVLMPHSPAQRAGFPPGANLPVLATFVNVGRSPDELVAVTSPAADRVSVSGATRLPPGRNVVSTIDEARPISPLVSGNLHIVLTTTQAVRPGLNTPVTFQFRNAGQVTLPVPTVVLEGE
ncbi:MAG TPA: copper chaperone PCu(A)C [Pseudonocardia sp.]|uniref:copper chaperone PCu(A)C n=1 Tax=Pseudonocardia sp. TaxID=60912 RepID=UPI002C662237|nr:copper chaperone PCu(A)C [Pseudonocardia sp.]HTF55578.1 copper chaperone PCu(A)C [Pseudonocardia sp.]